MPNQERSAQAFAGAVRDYLKDEDRSVRWLAKKAGIPDSTLRFQLDRPDRLTVENSLRIAAALGWDRERYADAAVA